MRVSEIAAYQGEYLRAEELQQAVKVTVDTVCLEELRQQDGQMIQMLVVAFVGARKRLVLNKTRALQMAGILGDDTDGWGGREVVLAPTRQSGKPTIHVREAAR